jgi:hypothetical protein
MAMADDVILMKITPVYGLRVFNFSVPGGSLIDPDHERQIAIQRGLQSLIGSD